MNRNLSRGILLVFLLGFMGASPAKAIPTATLNLLNTPVAIGDNFSVEVWADGDDIGLDFLSFGFDVSFDGGGIFQYTAYELGLGFDDDNITDTGNDVAGSIFPGTADNNVLLATLSFTTLTFGTDTLNVTGLYDGIFSGLYYELPDWSPVGYDIDASLTISTGAKPIPEPATVLLIFTGLIAFVGAHRKIKK